MHGKVPADPASRRRGREGGAALLDLVKEQDRQG